MYIICDNDNYLETMRRFDSSASTGHSRQST